MGAPLIPIHDLYSVGIVVRDLWARMESFSRFFGISRWAIFHITPERVDDAQYGGKTATPNYKVATGIVEGAFETAESFVVDLICPIDGESIFADFLDSKGEGMIYFSPNVIGKEDFASSKAQLESSGIPIAESFHFAKTFGMYFIDTQEKLGALTRLVVSDYEDWIHSAAPDEIVTFSFRKKYHPLPIRKLYHTGIVVPDRQKAKKGYEEIFGIQNWVEFELKTGDSMAKAAMYGRPVEHAFSIWIGRMASFSVELIEPKGGESVYQEMLNTKGGGMHHLFTTLCHYDEFESMRPFFEERHITIAQSGRLLDAAEYFYLDTRKELGGVTLEVMCPLRNDWLSRLLPPEQLNILIGS